MNRTEMGLVSISDTFNEGFEKYTPFLKNKAVTGILVVILILYASIIAPSLPGNVLRVFGYWWFRLIAIFLIVYLSIHNATIALLCAIALMISIYALNKYTTQENMSPVSNTMDDPSGTMAHANLQMKTANMEQMRRAINSDSQNNEKDIKMSFYDRLKSAFSGSSETSTFVSLHEESLSGIPMDKYNHKKTRMQEMADEVQSLLGGKPVSNGELKNVCSGVIEKNKVTNEIVGYDETPIYGTA